ncbi:MAG: sulfotransferase family 2 domain-containing protein [Planctomycetaceae bacterium]|nr:sulfotransferase family 2 domain-containing protein [Planctomycetaceae bacterium]
MQDATPQKASAPDDACVIFLHIPKCGGNSFLDFLRASIPPGGEFDVYVGFDYARRLQELEALGPDERAKLRFVFGHLPWGVHRLLPQPATYVTLLRHPVDRIVSHYSFVKANKRHPLHETVLREKLSLIDYARSGLTGELENGQTRLLCGRPELDSLRGHGHVLYSHLQEAMENLLGVQTRFGLVEYYDASQQVIAQDAGWPPPPPATRKNVTSGRPPLAAVSLEEWQAIVDRNPLDMELYFAALREFERRAASCGVALQADCIPQEPVAVGRRLLARLRRPATKR